MDLVILFDDKFWPTLLGIDLNQVKGPILCSESLVLSASRESLGVLFEGYSNASNLRQNPLIQHGQPILTRKWWESYSMEHKGMSRRYCWPNDDGQLLFWYKTLHSGYPTTFGSMQQLNWLTQHHSRN